MMQQQREIGQSGIKVTPLMLGGNVFGWTANEAASHSVLDAFVELGGNAIDTADVYSSWVPGHEGGESERVIGSWLKKSGKRDKVVISTKGGWDGGLRRENIVARCDASLQRLGVETIDLYWLHRDDGKTPAEEYVAALDDLLKAGKVRSVGLSNFEPDRFREGIAEAGKRGVRLDGQQPEYSLMNRAIEAELAPLCVRERVSIFPYFSLASGYLTGKYRTAADKAKSARGGRMDKYMAGKGPAVLAALDAVSARHRATPAQVSLAWLMAKPAIAAPIASATSVVQLKELMGALALTLSAEDVADLDRASA
jgi:aryl-alcohol dehydrogenase-like predicted oxidoreductase